MFNCHPGYPLSKHPEFSSNQQKFQQKFTIVTRLFKTKFLMCVCSTVMQLFTLLSLAALPVILLQAGAITVEAS
jgi:hypothetical protein